MELITLITAKQAKEKGVNQYTDKPESYCYFNNFLLRNAPRYYSMYVTDLDNKADNKTNHNYEYFLVPYQYELMDWLREEHNIYISIIPSVTMALKSKVSFTYQISSDSNGEKFNIYSSSMDCYSNYEECLETALQEALKMI